MRRFTIDERGKVVVHNVVAEPSPKQHWFQHFNLVVAHLVVRYENRSSSGPSPLRVSRLNIQIATLSSSGLRRNRSQDPIKIVCEGASKAML